VRIVSLLPSTTEILFAIGAGDDVVGVTFECDYPAEARTRRIVSTSAMPEGLTPAEIDGFVVAAMARGDDLYHLDEGALSGLDADLVVTQDLCAVCAVDVSVVDDALAHLGCTAEVLTIDPHTIDEVLESILTLGRATGHLAEAEALVAEQRRRLGAAWRQTMGRSRPRVMFLEWTDPPFAPGHWIPEMIELAGGDPLLATGGE
jgi:iron complex transport system substrate-binding protein